MASIYDGSFLQNTLREKYPYSELFWSVFSRIRTEYREIRKISSYSVRMQENTDLNNSEYGCFLRSDSHRLLAVNYFHKKSFIIEV